MRNDHHPRADLIADAPDIHDVLQDGGDRGVVEFDFVPLFVGGQEMLAKFLIESDVKIAVVHAGLLDFGVEGGEAFVEGQVFEMDVGDDGFTEEFLGGFDGGGWSG